MTRPEQQRPDSSRPDAAPATEVADRLLSASEGDRAMRARLEADLWAAFEADPLEDCMNHPAEKIIEEALRGQDEFPVLEWFRAFSHDAAHPGFAASVLRCLGRQASAGTASWRADLVREGLAADCVEIRDAAAQAAESWGDLRAVLEAHLEPVPWLRDYIRGIIDDL